MVVHNSGECVFNGCDKPSVLEGYCPFHYNIIAAQRNNKILGQMVSLLSSMDDRLSNMENKLQVQQPISQSTPISQNIKSPSISTSEFIPSIEISNSIIETKNSKSTQTKKDIISIAQQLKEAT